jgi:hypothetical protein
MTFTLRGRYYINRAGGHGKNFYYTERAYSIYKIHRCEVSADFGAQDGAMFLHFDNFKYDHVVRKIPDDSIKNLVQSLLKV